MVEEGKKLISENSPFAKEYMEYKLDSNKLATIIYTSGTTGDSKGVMLSHKNLMSDVNNATPYIDLFGRGLCVLPLHHAFAFTACILATHYFGVDIIINKSLKTVLSDLQKYKPNNILLVLYQIGGIFREISYQIGG